MLIFLWMVVQVCLESLPISSSGHTSLLLFYYPQSHRILSLDQLKHFDSFLHSITLFVITIFFWNIWWHMILRKNFHIRYLIEYDFWKKLAPAFIFVSLATFVFSFLYIAQSFFTLIFFQIPLSLGFFITAFELLYMNHLISSQKSYNPVSWNIWHAIILGSINSLVVHIPGVSRFGTNFLLCQFFGYKPADAFAVSWMVFIPFALAGGLYGAMKVWDDSYLLDQVLRMPMLLGMVGAGIVSYMLLYYFAYLIHHKKLDYLAWYMIIPIVLSLGLVF